MSAHRRAKLLRAPEAQIFVDRIEDGVTRELVTMPYREALRHFDEGVRLPVSDLDMLFFVEGLFLSCSCHERIEVILNGADIRWFPEDDEEIKNATFCPLPTRPPSRLAPRLLDFSLSSLIRWHEANWLTSSIGDVATLQLVGIALAAFGRHELGLNARDEPRLPMGCALAPLDLLFCAEVLLATFSDKDLIRSVLAGRKIPQNLGTSRPS